MLAVSGKGLSVREIEQLAHGFFRGPESFREEIPKGNLALPLARMRQMPQSPDACSEFERVLLGDLESAEVYAARDGQEPGSAADQPGLSRPVPFVDGGHPEPLARLFSHLEATP